jgi:hypothetical protein
VLSVSFPLFSDYVRTARSALNKFSFSLCLLLSFAPKVPLNQKKNLKQRSVSVDREAADDGNLEEPLKLRRPKEHVEGNPAVHLEQNLYIRAFLDTRQTFKQLAK